MSTYCDMGRALRLTPAEILAAAYAANPLIRPLTEDDERGLHPDALDPRAVASIPLTWPPNTAVNVHFDGGTPADQARVKKVVETWERVANVFFIYDPAQPSQIRIRFAPNDGNWSAVGTQAVSPAYAGRPTMNLANRDSTGALEEGTILHEFGHALGFWHEHQHPECPIQWNEAAVLKYFTGPPNNWSEAGTRQNVLTRLNPRGKFWGPWDPTSIMEYEIQPGWNAAGQHIGPNSVLSGEDIRIAGQLYPNRIAHVSAAHPAELSCPGPQLERAVMVSLRSAGEPIAITTPVSLCAAVFDRTDTPRRLLSRSLDAGHHELVLDAPPGDYALRLRAAAPIANGGAIRVAVGAGASPARAPVPEYAYKIFSGDSVELVATTIAPADAQFHIIFGSSTDPSLPHSYTRPRQGEVLQLTSGFVAGANQVHLRHLSSNGVWTVRYDLRINGKPADHSPFTGQGNAWFLDRFHFIADLIFLFKG